MFSTEKIVYVLKLEQSYFGNVSKFLKQIQDAICKIPEQYKKSATISITTESCGCYDDYTPCIEIYYTRQKTKEELQEESTKDKIWKQKRIKDLEQELEVLKKK